MRERKERRMLPNDKLKEAAMAVGLKEGSEVIVRERSLLKDGSYITRIIRRGTVVKLYDYHFSCQMATGERESFRYNELLGWEARLIRLKGKASQDAFSVFGHKKRTDYRFFFRYEDGGI